MPEITASEWGGFLITFPETHILQSVEWGELKSRYGWKAVRILTDQSQSSLNTRFGAQVLFRPLPFGFSLGYVPKGPVPNNNISLNDPLLWSEIDSACIKRRTAFLKVEPDIFSAVEFSPHAPLQDNLPGVPGFQHSGHSIQPPRTLLIDISGNENNLLAQMKQKTRYNIRLAQKKGIVVSKSSDIQTFHQIMQMTGARDRFGVHSQDYYQAVYDLFHPQDQCEIFLASYQGLPVACLFALRRGQRAWYFYGGSADVHRELMPAYLLQWEAMLWARSLGCIVYDLWGVPDFDRQYLESEFASRSGGLWGVYRFKRGFGGELSRAAGPWDKVYIPTIYSLYRIWMNLNSSRQEVIG